MSWMQWRGEVWPATKAEAELHLHLWPRDSACPRQSWSWHLHHHPKEIDENAQPGIGRRAGITVMDLNLQLEQWHRLADREIRADPAWHDLHEHTNEHGNLALSEATLLLTDLKAERRERGAGAHQSWVAHDFTVRLGAREGFIIPVEFEGWMMPQEDYYCLQPESAEEAAHFSGKSSNLRAMARTCFRRCRVALDRCEDPVPRAREYLRDAIGLDLPSSTVAKIGWNSHRKLPDGKSEPRPGWRSVVEFDLPNEEA